MYPDYLPATGFEPVADEEELASFCHRVIQRGTTVQVPDSELKLVRWSPGNGIQIWMFVNPGNEVETLVPFYTPAETVSVKIDRVHPSPDAGRGQVLITGWLLHDESTTDSQRRQTVEPGPDSGFDGAGGGPESEAYQFLFHCTDGALYRPELESTDRKEVQLLASARRPKRYVDQSAFEEAVRSWATGMEISSRSVIPSGMIDLDTGLRKEDASAKPYAYVTGRVRDAHLRQNPATDRSFFHITLDTHGMELDVLLGKNTLSSLPETGNIIEGHFLLLGMWLKRD